MGLERIMANPCASEASDNHMVHTSVDAVNQNLKTERREAGSCHTHL